jgi:hypothetical protein
MEVRDRNRARMMRRARGIGAGPWAKRGFGMCRAWWVVLVCAVSLGLPGDAWAGMPNVLTEDLRSVMRLNAEPHQRLQTISFFLVGLAISTLGVRTLWNVLARDFPRMPRLTYFKALVLVLLWGFAFIVVLTMIAGARELMTPGAWKKNGLTYSVRDSSIPNEADAPDWKLKPIEGPDAE